MLKQGMTMRYVDPLLAGQHGLQELSKIHYQISLARTRLQHSLMTHYLPLYFPEIERCFDGAHADWFFRFMLRFPAAALIRQLNWDAFREEAWELVGRKVNKQAWLTELYQCALGSICLPVDDDSIGA